MRYKAILFDNDDTLMDFQAGNRNAVNRLMDELGYFHPDRYEQYQAVNRELWAALERGEIAQSELRLRRFMRLYDLFPIPGDPRAASDRFVTLLGEQSILLPHAEEVVREIASRLPVIIVTNGMTVIQKNRLAKSPLKNLIRGMVISEELGVSKPRPEIFWQALRPLSVAPEDALMIGDGLSSDIRGANNAGIAACWLNPSGAALPSGVHAEYIIRDLRESVEIALQE